MTENTGDSPSLKSYLTLTRDFKLEWETFLGNLGLTEVDQDRHTHFYSYNQAAHWRTSKIDRFYFSLNGGEKTVVLPHAFVLTASGADLIREIKHGRGGPGTLSGSRPAAPRVVAVSSSPTTSPSA